MGLSTVDIVGIVILSVIICVMGFLALEALGLTHLLSRIFKGAHVYTPSATYREALASVHEDNK